MIIMLIMRRKFMQNIFVIGFCFLRLPFYMHRIWGEIYPSSGFANTEKTGFLEKIIWKENIIICLCCQFSDLLKILEC